MGRVSLRIIISVRNSFEFSDDHMSVAVLSYLIVSLPDANQCSRESKVGRAIGLHTCIPSIELSAPALIDLMYGFWVSSRTHLSFSAMS